MEIVLKNKYSVGSPNISFGIDQKEEWYELEWYNIRVGLLVCLTGLVVRRLCNEFRVQ